MTDLRKHLPEIFKLLEKKFKSGPDTLHNIDFCTELRQLLPASYFVTSGRVASTDGQTISESLGVILGDRTLADFQPGADTYPVHAVLAVLEIADQHNAATLGQALVKIASVKRLRPAQAVPADRLGAKAIPKQLFPLGVVFFRGFAGAEQFTTEQLAINLASLLQEQSPAERPDYLIPVGLPISYRNPVFDGAPVVASSLGFGYKSDPRKPRLCYVCKNYYSRVHFFYAQLCPACGDFNYFRRNNQADLSGKIALVTGARLKIGYAVALRLLRGGAQVIATTRFPRDAARRFAAEPDFARWQANLHIYGLDLRHLPGLESFIKYLTENYSRLDILINNAAQTIRRPPAFYAHLLAAETAPLEELPAALRGLLPGENLAVKAAGETDLLQLRPTTTPASLTQVSLLPTDTQSDSALFPPGEYDADGQQVDRRPQNSWILKLDEIALPEMLEVQLVNAIAPATLVAQLKPLLSQTPGLKFIINVSAIEGQFSQEKRGLHTHTNMAKAALNMLTFSSAEDYAEAGIFMNSVDPGWVSDQSPTPAGQPKREAADLPLDLTDAAARVCDPIYSALQTNTAVYGKLFKDYKVTDW